MALRPPSYIIPAEEISREQILQIKRNLADQLVAALQRFGIQQASIVTRDLVPNDLVSNITRLQNGNSTSLGKTTFTSLFATAPALTATQAIGLFGFESFQASPAPAIDVLKMFLGSGGTPIGQVRVSSIYTDNRLARGYFTPFIWLPNETLDVQAVANGTVAQNGETFDLLGIIAEISGKTITPRNDLDGLVPLQ